MSDPRWGELDGLIGWIEHRLPHAVMVDLAGRARLVELEQTAGEARNLLRRIKSAVEGLKGAPDAESPPDDAAFVRAYVKYLHVYICELANRTDISFLPLPMEEWAPQQGASRAGS